MFSQEAGDHACASHRPRFKFCLLTVPFAVCFWALHCIFLRLGFFRKNEDQASLHFQLGLRKGPASGIHYCTENGTRLPCVAWGSPLVTLGSALPRVAMASGGCWHGSEGPSVGRAYLEEDVESEGHRCAG